jgi:hypothetical protein
MAFPASEAAFLKFQAHVPPTNGSRAARCGNGAKVPIGGRLGGHLGGLKDKVTPSSNWKPILIHNGRVYDRAVLAMNDLRTTNLKVIDIELEH